MYLILTKPLGVGILATAQKRADYMSEARFRKISKAINYYQ